MLWGLAAAVVSAGILSYPVYRQARAWRANSLASEAEGLLDDPDTRVRAWELAQAASSLHPEGVEVARALAKVYDVGDPQAAHPFWERVLELSGGEPEDRLALAEAYLSAGLWERFEEELLLLDEVSHEPLYLRHLQIMAAGRQGDLEGAFRMAEALVEEEECPEETDWLYVQMSQLSSEPAVRRAGIDHLWTMVGRGGDRGLAALRNLARAPGLPEEELWRLVAAIEAFGAEDRADRLLAEQIRSGLSGVPPQEVYERAAMLFDLNDPLEQASLGRWLNRQGLHEYTLRAVPEENAVARQDLFLVRADAMAVLGQWSAIGDLLDRPRVPLEEYLRAFFRMRVYLETGDKKRARLAWDGALLAAGRDSVKLNYLAEKAKALGLSVFQIGALRRIVETPLMRRGAFQELVQVLQRDGKTDELSAVLHQMLEYFPDEREALNDVLYLGFLAGTAEEDSLERARALMGSNPEMLAYRMTVVMGLLRQEELAESLKLLVELPVNWFQVRDRWRMLTAVVLHRQGYEEEARRLIERTNRDSLLPEERTLYDEVR